MREAPIHSETCTYLFRPDNRRNLLFFWHGDESLLDVNWVYGNLFAWFGWVGLYKDRLVLKILFITACDIRIGDIEKVKIWDSVGARVRIFMRGSATTLVFTTLHPIKFGTELHKLGVHLDVVSPALLHPETDGDI